MNKECYSWLLMVVLMVVGGYLGTLYMYIYIYWVSVASDGHWLLVVV